MAYSKQLANGSPRRFAAEVDSAGAPGATMSMVGRERHSRGRSRWRVRGRPRFAGPFGDVFEFLFYRRGYLIEPTGLVEIRKAHVPSVQEELDAVILETEPEPDMFMCALEQIEQLAIKLDPGAFVR